MLARYLVFFALVVGLVACPRAAGCQTALGANMMDLAAQYQGLSSNGMGTGADIVTRTSMGRVRLADAAAMGLSIVRVAVMGYGPDAPEDLGNHSRNELAPWIISPVTYWQHMDAMFDDLDVAGLQIVPVFVWNSRQIPTIAGETVETFMRWPGRSQGLLLDWIRSFVERYAARKTIAFYEFCNECNLDADLDMVRRCPQQMPTTPQRCASYGNFRTRDVLVLAHTVTRLIRSLDTQHRISSGFSFPREDAWWRFNNPEWLPAPPNWPDQIDSAGEFVEYMDAIYRDFDVISGHIYPSALPGLGWFGRPYTETVRLVGDLAEYAHSRGKVVFIGEFGDPNTSGTSAPLAPTPWLQDLLAALRAWRVEFASFWILDWYPTSTYEENTSDSLDPMRSPDLAQTYAQFSGTSTLGGAPPTVALVWPAPCDLVENWKSFAYAVVGGVWRVDSVDFGIDGQPLASIDAPPFVATLPQSLAGLHKISVTAHVGPLASSYSYDAFWNVDPIANAAACGLPGPVGPPSRRAGVRVARAQGAAASSQVVTEGNGTVPAWYATTGSKADAVLGIGSSVRNWASTSPGAIPPPGLGMRVDAVAIHGPAPKTVSSTAALGGHAVVGGARWGGNGQLGGPTRISSAGRSRAALGASLSPVARMVTTLNPGREYTARLDDTVESDGKAFSTSVPVPMPGELVDHSWVIGRSGAPELAKNGVPAGREDPQTETPRGASTSAVPEVFDRAAPAVRLGKSVQRSSRRHLPDARRENFGLRPKRQNAQVHLVRTWRRAASHPCQCRSIGRCRSDRRKPRSLPRVLAIAEWWKLRKYLRGRPHVRPCPR